MELDKAAEAIKTHKPACTCRLCALAAEMHRVAEQFQQLRADIEARIAGLARELEDTAKAEGG